MNAPYKLDPYLRGQIEALAQAERLKVQIQGDDELLVSLYAEEPDYAIPISSMYTASGAVVNPPMKRIIRYQGSPQVILAYLHGRCGV